MTRLLRSVLVVFAYLAAAAPSPVLAQKYPSVAAVLPDAATVRSSAHAPYWITLADGSSVDLNANWLDDTKNLNEARFLRVVRLIETDPDAKAVLARAMNLVGARSALDLMAFIKICDGKGKLGNADGNTIGHSPQMGSSMQIIPEDYENPGRSETLIQQAKRAHSEPVVDIYRHEGFSYVIGWSNPAICIVPSDSIAQAAIALAHEMVHFTAFMERNTKEDASKIGLAPLLDEEASPQLLAYADGDDYARSIVRDKGGEKDAYVIGLKLQSRLFGQDAKRGALKCWRDLYDDLGDFIGTGEQVAQRVLDPNCAGYLQALRADYSLYLTTERNTLATVRQNLTVASQDSERQNLELQALAAAARRSGDAQSASTCEDRASMARAAIARIGGRIAAADRNLERLDRAIELDRLSNEARRAPSP